MTYPNKIIDLSLILESLLGSQGINVLGIYELLAEGQMADEAPAIQIRTATDEPVIRRMKPESGIECILEPNADFTYIPRKNRGGDSLEFYFVTLDQHDPYSTLDEAVRIIYRHSGIRPLDSPIVRPRMELPGNQGIAPARAFLKIPCRQYVPSLF